MIRVLIADDHSILREGMRLILSADPAFDVVGEATNGEDAVARAQALLPDVVLMDVHMPGMNGIEATRRIHATLPQVRVMILTVSDKDEDLFGAIRAGAKGYLLKNSEASQVLDAIRRLANGEAVLPPALAARVLDEFAAPPQAQETLTEREIEIIRLVAQGLGNKEIATKLSLSENTVKTHVRHILDKLQLRSRSEAAAYAVQAGLIKSN
ncbi:MAG: response regulator transcription factor [Chloroflexi bacterium]|nr:response regulator transcription factor [Chloroflexota bacterium]